MEQKKSGSRARFIFFTLFLEALGVGLLIPVFPDIIRRFSHNESYINIHYGYFISIYALMQFLASPILGSLSDRYGRRPILLSSLFGAALDYLLMAFAPTLFWLYLGRVISGLTGAAMTVASSYMADISDDSNRSANFGLIGAAFGLGFIAGPMIGGLLSSWGPMMPFFVAAFGNLINFLFGYFILPESLPLENRRKIEIKKLNPLLSLKKILTPSPILLMVLAYFLIFLAGHVHPSVWTLYTQYKFKWSSFDVGLSLSLVGLSSAFVQGYLTRILIPKWGEKGSIYIGMSIQIVSFILFGLATEGWMAYVVLIFTGLSGIAMPALQSKMSKEVPSNEQGELQGTLVSLASLTAIVGPLFYTHLFDLFTNKDSALATSARESGWDFSGAPYYGAAFIASISLMVIVYHFKVELGDKESKALI